MSDLRELYQEIILDHNRQPRNFGTMADANHEAEGYNPLCGDQLKVFLRMSGDVIDGVQFEGSGCAISKASASLMTEAVKGKTLAEAEELYEGFHELLTGDPSEAGKAPEELGKLAVFEGVREFPVRVKCATLAWHTFQAALSGGARKVSTEWHVPLGGAFVQANVRDVDQATKATELSAEGVDARRASRVGERRGGREAPL